MGHPAASDTTNTSSCARKDGDGVFSEVGVVSKHVGLGSCLKKQISHMLLGREVSRESETQNQLRAITGAAVIRAGWTSVVAVALLLNGFIMTQERGDSAHWPYQTQ